MTKRIDIATLQTGMPPVSVVVPTIGRPALRAAIDSVRRQSVPPYEIVVVNDSPDQASVTSDLGVEVVEVFTGGQKGTSAARNRGVDRARGELIAYLDDDDWWFPHHIASALHWLDRIPELDVYASTVFQAHANRLERDSRVVFRGRQNLINFFYGRYCWAHRRRSIAPSTWVFRRERCDLPMDEEVHHHEDIWWLLNMDRRKKVIRQWAKPSGVKPEHPAGSVGRHIARGTPEELIKWAQRLESLREGAGCHFIIGVMGRDYARKGLRDNWVELIGSMPREWRISSDYRMMRAIEKSSLGLRRGESRGP